LQAKCRSCDREILFKKLMVFDDNNTIIKQGDEGIIQALVSIQLKKSVAL